MPRNSRPKRTDRHGQPGTATHRAIPAEARTPMDTAHQTRSQRDRDPRTRRKALLRAQVPYLSSVRSPREPTRPPGPPTDFSVASYNVHRWTGPAGGRRWQPELACDVIAELGADVIALQEVLRSFDRDNPLDRLADDLRYHLAFVSTRMHRRGELGNAILTRWPMAGVFTIDLSRGRVERRSAIVAQLRDGEDAVAIVATHLALVDRTRERQVGAILSHPRLQGPALLLGDMNAWRRCPATRELDREFANQHHNDRWPATFPSARPVMALDRVYARGARVADLRAHRTDAARRGSDHLPVLAHVSLDS